jgi:hypothetical protein
MTPEQAAKLKKLHDRGYIISIDSSYVDTPVRSIYEEDGDILFDSEVFAGEKLSRHSQFDVKVSKPIQNCEAE